MLLPGRLGRLLAAAPTCCCCPAAAGAAVSSLLPPVSLPESFFRVSMGPVASGVASGAAQGVTKRQCRPAGTGKGRFSFQPTACLLFSLPAHPTAPCEHLAGKCTAWSLERAPQRAARVKMAARPAAAPEQPPAATPPPPVFQFTAHTATAASSATAQRSSRSGLGAARCQQRRRAPPTRQAPGECCLGRCCTC